MPALSRAPVAALVITFAVALTACGGEQDRTSDNPATPATTGAAGSSPGVGGGSPDTTAAPFNTFSVRVAGGSIDGPSRIRVRLNQPVVLRVTSDVEDEVHVHGYDRTAGAGPGRVAEISFVANIPGTFEVELERAHRRLTTLEVQP